VTGDQDFTGSLCSESGKYTRENTVCRSFKGFLETIMNFYIPCTKKHSMLIIEKFYLKNYSLPSADVNRVVLRSSKKNCRSFRTERLGDAYE